MMMAIRDLTIEDMQGLELLYRQFWGERGDVEAMRQKFRKIASDPAYILLGAELGGELAGSVMGIVCEELYGGCRPFLVVENMVVDQAYRRHGVGKQLFAELERRATQAGCTQMLLVTETDRAAAREFYASVGFHPTANHGFKKKLV